jgi:ubiquinone/menaquinone biosynthesis C-methylase UbiE
MVLPWALQGTHPDGEVLEVGAGSGAMAAELLATHPDIRMTVTDFDATMVGAAKQRLAPFAERTTARQADATALPFRDNSFNFVLSWIMLHHTIEWEKALAEAVRVTRPGGEVVGYDLLNTAPLRALHQAEGARFRMMRLSELRETVHDLPVTQVILTPGLARFAVRFTLRK